MKITDYDKLIELTYMGGGWIPANENAVNLADSCAKGEVITLLEVTQRDIKFHRCYFALLKFIYSYLPKSFKNTIPEGKFYQFIKHQKKEYNVIFTFKDGTSMVEYDSIAFGRMSQKRFEEYIREQLPFIYENIIGAYFEGDIYNNIVETIETEFQRFLSKL